MLNLQRVTMFIAVVDAGSFTRPQRRWGRPRRWSALTYGSWKMSWGDAAAAFDAAFAAH